MGMGGQTALRFSMAQLEAATGHADKAHFTARSVLRNWKSHAEHAKRGGVESGEAARVRYQGVSSGLGRPTVGPRGGRWTFEPDVRGDSR